MKTLPLFLVLACSALYLGSGCDQSAAQNTAPATQVEAGKLYNRLENADWSVLAAGKPAGWESFEGGFALATGAGREGRNAILLQRAANDKAQGTKQNVTLDQETAAPVTISGWSKSENVSGTADNNYALFADITYQDGSNEWGVNAPFPAGTHDWKQAEVIFTPAKPVKSLSFYALLREHTGKAWFSDLSVTGAGRQRSGAETVALAAAVEVIGQKPSSYKPFVAKIPSDDAAMHIISAEFSNVLQNPEWAGAQNGVPAGWQKWGDGFTLQPGAGPNGAAAAQVERAENGPEYGIWQTLELNQKAAAPVQISGWSKAENVSGSADPDYSLYADITFADGSSLWGESIPFRTGTHDWQRVQHLIVPEKPVKSINVYGLFRKHTGKAWFSNLSVGLVRSQPGAALFDSLAIQTAAKEPARLIKQAPLTYLENGKGFTLGVEPNSGRISGLEIDGRNLADSDAPAGFLVRDVANGSDFFHVFNGDNDSLKLKLDAKVSVEGDHFVIEGKLEDTSGMDRAVSLVYALPIDATGWQWDDHIRESRSIVAGEEYANTVPFFAGSNGRQSLYPVANIHNTQDGLALCVDMNQAAQNRIAYNAATKQFYIAYDFGLTAEKPAADFRFVLYRTDPKWGFRDATAKMYGIFRDMFAVRGENKEQGLWMPFTDIRKINNPDDFGFRYREAGDEAFKDGSIAWDDAHNVLSFRYSEPMTWWMAMPASTPRTYENALLQLRSIAADEKNPLQAQALAVISSGFRDDNGRLTVTFANTPWSNGAVWSLNPQPGLPGKSTGASLLWSDAKRHEFYGANTQGKLDGEYLDSLEGYMTANLDYEREHFAHTTVPLTFDTGTHQPAQHKALLVYDFTRWQSRDVHKMGKLMFANSVPYRFTFLTPWLDVMGTEANWLPEGKWSPDSDSLMNLRRTMSAGKPYLLLQNTNYEKFTSPYVEKYMQRTLFYGVFPGFFSADAATDPYWLNPKMYERDRPLFKRYIPVIKSVAEAGWQPVTGAVSDNPQIWAERFGKAGGTIYLTLRNNAATAQTATLNLSGDLAKTTRAQDLLTKKELAVQNSRLAVSLQPDQTVVLRVF